MYIGRGRMQRFSGGTHEVRCIRHRPTFRHRAEHPIYDQSGRASPDTAQKIRALALPLSRAAGAVRTDKRAPLEGAARGGGGSAAMGPAPSWGGGSRSGEDRPKGDRSRAAPDKGGTGADSPRGGRPLSGERPTTARRTAPFRGQGRLAE